MDEPIDSDELLKQLSDIRESKEGLAKMINDAKTGNSSTSISSLMRLEDRLLLDELNIQTNLVKLRKIKKNGRFYGKKAGIGRSHTYNKAPSAINFSSIF